MMRIFHFCFLAIMALTFVACDEIPPIVSGSMGEQGDDSDVKNQKRQVLIEEFTGVRCVNCPAGSALIEDLLAIHGAQLVAVSIHAGEFSPPYPQSQHDFRTPEGTELLNFLGQPFGYPTAVINRRKFQGQFSLQLGQGKWAGYIEEEKAIPPKIRIDIDPVFNAATRELKAVVTLYVDEELGTNTRLSVLLTESGIKDAQLTPSSAQPDVNYVHKHVFRTMLSKVKGDELNHPTNPIPKGTVIKHNFSKILPTEWKEEKCKLIAFVSLHDAQKDVIQAHQVPLFK